MRVETRLAERLGILRPILEAVGLMHDVPGSGEAVARTVAEAAFVAG